MASSGVGILQRIRQCAGPCTIEEGTRAANRHGLDLVGRPNKFRKSREGKTAPPKIARRPR